MTPAEVLLSEADWLDGAHANSEGRGFSAQFRDGFKAAASWVRFHGQHPHVIESRIPSSMHESEEKYTQLIIRLTMLHAKWIDQASALDDPRRGEHAGIWHCTNDLWDLLTTSKEKKP